MTSDAFLLLYRDLEATDLNMLADCSQGHYKSLDNRMALRETIIAKITAAANQLTDCSRETLAAVQTAQKNAMQRDRRIRDVMWEARDVAKLDWQKSRGSNGSSSGNPYAAGERPRMRVTL